MSAPTEGASEGIVVVAFVWPTHCAASALRNLLGGRRLERVEERYNRFGQLVCVLATGSWWLMGGARESNRRADVDRLQRAELAPWA